MRHRNYGSKLGRQPAHRRATLRNLVTNVIEKERITTTLTRAKAAKPLVEQMITLGKRDTLHTRRQAASYLMTPNATKKLFADIAPRFSDRAGGYTRILKMEARPGDSADMALMQLVESAAAPAEKAADSKGGSAKKGRKKKDADATGVDKPKRRKAAAA